MTRPQVPMQKSLATLETIVLPGDTNVHDTMFGGLLMEIIDKVAAISARRHCHRAVVTASNDGVHFHRPIQNDDIVMLESFVCAAGRSSMEIFVKIMTENVRKDLGRQIAAVSFLTFVGLGDDGKPAEIPDVYPESPEEELLYRDRIIRKQARLKKREETIELIQSLANDSGHA